MTAFYCEANDGKARAGYIDTLHGRFHTPAFMPVGTHAAVRACHPDEVRSCGAEIILGNAYHLILRPGIEIIQAAGGLQSFMGWNGPILTDSGGYQLISLSNIATLNDDGVTFISPYDGKRVYVTPEDAVRSQAQLGSDIIMCLDNPLPYGTSQVDNEKAMKRTHDWARRCRSVHPETGQLLFGIAQGGFNPRNRVESADIIVEMDFDGIAIGGLAVGEPVDIMEEMARASVSRIPESYPRYFMGLGTDRELLTMIACGIDMFDCVVPTRLARHGTAITSHGNIVVRRAAYREDMKPLEEGCACIACSRFSRAYIRHLICSGEILGHRLLSLHNIMHICHLMKEVRQAIIDGEFTYFYNNFMNS